MTTNRLMDRVLVIVGGTSGLGLSAAEKCLDEGAALVVVGRSDEKCSAALEKLGPAARALAGDAAQPTTSVEAIELACREFGRLDGLYHVAGGSGRSRGDGPLDQVTDEGWDFTLRTNLDSLFYSNRAAIRQFLEQGDGGTILNMASVLGWSPSPKFFATHTYATTKAAAIGMTKAAASYYASHNIRINAIAPALVDTPLAQRAVQDAKIMKYVATKQPLDGGRVGYPADVDSAVVFFLSDESRFVTGQVLAVDGGWCVTEGSTQE